MPLFSPEGVDWKMIRLKFLLPHYCYRKWNRKGTREWEGSRPLTEHALQPDEAADETVEVNVHVFVCVSHGNDVIELAVEVESCGGNTGEEEGERRK